MNDHSEAPHWLSVALSVADGHRVDWEESSNGEMDREREDLLEELKEIERIVKAHSGPAPPAPRGLASGSRWGHLEIREQVGEGSYGVVHRAWDTRLGREVALKLLRSHEAADGDSPELVSEGRLLARINHPNVVTVYGADYRDGIVGIWMEYVRGRTMEDRLREDGLLGPREATLVGIELCTALAAVHGAGLVHGDVKARNVIRQDGGRLLLMDFSSSRNLTAGMGVDENPAVTGTPLYTAPEVLRGEARGVRSDLYSLGALLFHLVTGGFPVAAATLTELRKAHVMGDRKWLRDERPDLPPPFVEVVERTLRPDPLERYATAGEMETALQGALAFDENGRRRPEGRLWRIDRTRRLFLALAAFAGVAMFIMIAAGLGVLGPGSGSYEVGATLYRAGSVRHEPLVPGAVVRPGDQLFLELAASRDVHVYVLSEDERGEAFLLFPLPGFERKNPLPGQSTHRLPGNLKGQPMFWEVTSTGGREHVLVVVSPRRLTDLETVLGELPIPKGGVQVTALPLPPAAARRLRGIGGVAQGPQGDGTAEARAGALEHTRVLDIARRLGADRQSAHGVWTREFELQNPGR